MEKKMENTIMGYISIYYWDNGNHYRLWGLGF